MAFDQPVNQKTNAPAGNHKKELSSGAPELSSIKTLNENS